MMMKQEGFNTLVGAIFAVIAVLHLLRIIYSWSAQIGTFAVPIWLSWAALVVSAFLSYTAFRLNK